MKNEKSTIGDGFKLVAIVVGGATLAAAGAYVGYHGGHFIGYYGDIYENPVINYATDYAPAKFWGEVSRYVGAIAGTILGGWGGASLTLSALEPKRNDPPSKGLRDDEGLSF